MYISRYFGCQRIGDTLIGLVELKIENLVRIPKLLGKHKFFKICFNSLFHIEINVQYIDLSSTFPKCQL